MHAEIDVLTGRFGPEYEFIERHLKQVTQEWNPIPTPALSRLWESVDYSLFSSGKRFRPLLAVLTAKALRAPAEKVLPLASAVELIHTYSLIHDDLPVMDNGDLRRGRPTNHKVFGDALALLAGDGLLTHAFYVLARGLQSSPQAAAAIEKVASAAGLGGMVGGQVLDISMTDLDENLMNDIHRLKTGALIQVSVEAAAILCGASDSDQKSLTAYGRALGLAFQLADDLQDAGEKIEKVNFVHVLGPERTVQLLKQATDDGVAALAGFGDDASGLRFLLTMNQERISFGG